MLNLLPSPQISHNTVIIMISLKLILKPNRFSVSFSILQLQCSFSLQTYGVKGDALSLIESYLTDRIQKCQVNGVVSSEHSVTCEITQGSILGPLLFLLYINDLPECLNHTDSRLFADDTNLTAAGRTINEFETAMNLVLESLKR